MWSHSNHLGSLYYDHQAEIDQRIAADRDSPALCRTVARQVAELNMAAILEQLTNIHAFAEIADPTAFLINSRDKVY